MGDRVGGRPQARITVPSAHPRSSPANGQAPLPASSPPWIAAYHRKSSRPDRRRLRPWKGHHLAVRYSCSNGQGLVPLLRFASQLWVARFGGRTQPGQAAWPGWARWGITPA